ncbi:MAG TPA: cytochrome c3 family protein [Kofleriaceae bacterium]|jgi:hypothetical protein
MRTRLIFTIVIALCAGVVAQPVLPDDGPDDWSPIVYPLQRLPLTFSHAKHLSRGVQCQACHPNGTTSRSAVDNLEPTETQCRTCHAIDRDDPTKQATPTAACASCHPGWAPGKIVEQIYETPSPLKFDHAAHVQTACESCHSVRAVDLATTRQLPSMQSCLKCHKTGEAPERCIDCHLAKETGLLETTFEHGVLVPARDGLGDQHGPGFKTDHKTEARQVGATCNACHDKSECVECHTGSVKPMDFHPGDYLMTHAVDARRGTPDCSACHRLESFCVACHERSGLGTRAESQFSSRDPSRFFHPPGWASQTAGGPNLHSQEARRNISECTSCHREEDCLTCHSAQPGAAHASPHPPNWRGSAQCRALDRGDRRMCLRCHVSQDEIGCDWHK